MVIKKINYKSKMDKRVKNNSKGTTRILTNLLRRLRCLKMISKFQNMFLGNIIKIVLYLFATVGRFSGGSNRDSGSQTEGAKTVTS